MKQLTVVVATAVGAAVMAGCSSGSSDVTLAGQKALAPYVQAVRDAAHSKSQTGLKDAVDQLKSAVQREENAGQVSASRAAEIDDAADQLMTDASPSASPSSTPKSTPPTTAPPTSNTPTATPTTPTPPPTSPSSGTSSSPGVGVSVSP